MGKTIRTILIGVMVWMSAGTLWAAAPKNEQTTLKDKEILPMLYAAMRSRGYIQEVAKAYLYAGNDVATSQAQREMEEALAKFDAEQKKLASAFTDPKTRNLMTFIGMNVDEIKQTLKEPYSLDNARVVIDLAEAISKGEKKIADSLSKKLSCQYPTGKGQSYLINEIAKYYMAYQAGIKDENTIRQMDKMVRRFDELIKEIQSYPGNTVKMNQTLNQMDKLWKVVKQFYLDIAEGGLPLIVYQTTNKLDAQALRYSQLVLKTMNDK